MSLFICPICKENLFLSGKTYRCKNNHCYDLAKENYVNLLPVNQKNSKNPGDDKAMVNARFAFLHKDYYKCLQKSISALCIEYTGSKASILDSGCGEGYYTNSIYQSMVASNKSVEMAGIDISKWAVRLAAKNSIGANYAVGSAFSLPISDNSIDLIINCFSPLCLEEFARVLKKDGYFLYIVPAAKHLWELKEYVYDKPYENEEKIEQYQGFDYIDKICARDTINLTSNEDIKNLFMMTPYAWKTSKSALAKLDLIEKLDVQISFHIHVYKKI